MQQLLMKWIGMPVIERPLPEGYEYAFYTGSQAEKADWAEICLDGLLPDTDPHWFNDVILGYPDISPEEDLLFVVRKSDGKRVATVAAIDHPNGEGYIHMLGSLPEVRGQGLGHCLTSKALEILAKRGSKYTILTTDDWRLGAIKIYTAAGMYPVLWHDDESDMKARWDAVYEKLGLGGVKYLDE